METVLFFLFFLINFKNISDDVFNQKKTVMFVTCVLAKHSNAAYARACFYHRLISVAHVKMFIGPTHVDGCVCMFVVFGFGGWI